MVRKQIQPHDFLNGGPELQFRIDFPDNWETDYNITFEGDTFTVTDGTTTDVTWTTHNDLVTLGFDGEGLRVDANNQVTINDLVVAGSAEIPPQIGQLKVDTETGRILFFDGSNWAPLYPSMAGNFTPSISRWGKIKRWVSNIRFW
jgi:hypothetical protein